MTRLSSLRGEKLLNIFKNFTVATLINLCLFEVLNPEDTSCAAFASVDVPSDTSLREMLCIILTDEKSKTSTTFLPEEKLDTLWFVVCARFITVLQRFVNVTKTTAIRCNGV